MKHYKQYFPAQEPELSRVISAQDDPAPFLLETLFHEGDFSYAREDFLPMRISFWEAEEPGTQEDCFAFSLCDSYPCAELTEWYVQAVRGELPRYLPIMALLHENCMVFLLASFLPDGKLFAVSEIRLNRFPASGEIRIEVGPHSDGLADSRSYVITNRGAAENSRFRYRMECFRNGVLNSTREFDRDEEGLFEWITEPG